MIEAIDIVPSLSGNPSLRYRVNLPERDAVYMEVSRTNFRNDKRYVVLVDATLLLQLWRNNRYSMRNLSKGNSATWKKDYKYDDAEHGFSYGIENPVPLSEVSCSPTLFRRYEKIVLFWRNYSKQSHEIGFTNGVTRTIWLLSHGVTEIPVLCGIQSAKMLHLNAGVKGSPLLSVDELIPKEFGLAGFIIDNGFHQLGNDQGIPIKEAYNTCR